LQSKFIRNMCVHPKHVLHAYLREHA
jgi:hypothetical protein